jgi:DNA-directed RNA polymerase sigma subunit (sigma70/sigma32)
MERAIGEAVDATIEAAKPLNRLEPVKARPPTLVEQMNKLETIERELQSRLRKEGVEAQIQAEMRVSEANVRFTRQLSEITADLTRKRDDEIRSATEEYHAKVDELAGLLRRRS